MNYCALSYYLKGHMANKQLHSFLLKRSLDDKSLSSLLESCTRSCISYACLYKFGKDYMA